MDKYLVLECQTVLSREGPCLEKSLQNFQAAASLTIDHLQKEKLKITEKSPQGTSLVIQKRLKEVQQALLNIKKTEDLLIGISIWTDDVLTLKRKLQIVKKDALEFALSSRGLLPEHILIANGIIRSLERIKAALKNVLGDLLT